MGEAAHAVFEVEAGGTEGGEVGRSTSASAPRTPGGSGKPCASTTSPQPRRLPAAKAVSPAHPPRREPAAGPGGRPQRFLIFRAKGDQDREHCQPARHPL